MTRSALAAWLITVARILDGHEHPIHRPLWFVMAVADTCIETATPQACAAELDVYAALETSYRIDAVGDHGRSCGLGQTPCGITPKDARGQLALAWSIHVRSALACVAFPNALYGTGHCAPWTEGNRREQLVAAAALTPWPGEADRDVDGLVEAEDQLP